MRKNKFTVLIERDEDGLLVATVPALRGCHTQGKTIDQLVERTKEAISLYLKSTKDKEIYSKFVGFLQIEV